ncbi:MAG TPA: peptide chain release factor N(5)-glutamine methyltransferase [Caulobacteraceae bacterium]
MEAALAARTLVSAWTAARMRLEAAGVDSPVINARLLVEAAASSSRTELISDPHRLLTSAQGDKLEAMLARREKREPMSHILGRKGFWKLMLAVTPDVLTPRPETETILDVVLAKFDPDSRFCVLDLGIGSGALLLTILTERPRACGLGVDISEKALAVAAMNAAALGLASRIALVRGDWTSGLASNCFDLVVCNPPYIPTEDIAGLAPEVRDHEPRVAIDGGRGGLVAYRLLAGEILRVLRPGGAFALEIGREQREPVERLAQAAGAVELAVIRDLAGRERVVWGAKKALGE